jgi:hypothetical protein
LPNHERRKPASRPWTKRFRFRLRTFELVDWGARSPESHGHPDARLSLARYSADPSCGFAISPDIRTSGRSRPIGTMPMPPRRQALHSRMTRARTDRKPHCG